MERKGRALNIEDEYPPDGIEEIRWDDAIDQHLTWCNATIDQYLTVQSVLKPMDNREFKIRPDVIPDTVIAQQDEMF